MIQQKLKSDFFCLAVVLFTINGEKKKLNLTARRKLMGNAVTTNIVKDIATKIIENGIKI